MLHTLPHSQISIVPVFRKRAKVKPLQDACDTGKLAGVVSGYSVKCQYLVVFGTDFKIGLAVAADGADFRSLRADDEVAADAAFPHAFAGLLEDLLHFDVLEELEVALFMGAFDGADGRGTWRQVPGSLLLRASLANWTYMSVHS